MLAFLDDAEAQDPAERVFRIGARVASGVELRLYEAALRGRPPAGDRLAALKLRLMRRDVDGCGTAPKPDDGVRVCQAQRLLREVIDAALVKLD